MADQSFSEPDTSAIFDENSINDETYKDFNKHPAKQVFADTINKTVTYKGIKLKAGTVKNDPNFGYVYHTYTKAELEQLYEAANADAQKHGFKSAADKQTVQAKTPSAITSGGDYDPNAAKAAPVSPWDSFAGGTQGNFSQSKISTGFTGDLPGGFNLPSNTPTHQDTLENLLKQFANDSPEQIKQIQEKLNQAGAKLTVSGVADTNTIQAYSGILQNTLLSQTNHQNVTPDELLDSLAKAGAAAAAKGSTATEKSTSVNLTDPATAKGVITSAIADKLGRAPTTQEVADFTNALNAAEKADPTVTTTTRVSNSDLSEKSSNSTSTGGSVDPSAFATQYVGDNHGPEAQAVQALSFYNVALQALGNGGVNTGLPT